MLLPVVLLLAAAQPAGGGPRAASDTWPGPLIVIEDVAAPEIVAYLQPELELVAVRLSVSVREYAGAVSGAVAHQQLVRDRLVAAAARLGGRVHLGRGPTHAVYTVVGPARELPGLVGALRQALLAPAGTAGDLAAAWARAEQYLLTELELPASLVRRSLWQRFEAADDAGDALVAVAGPGELDTFWRHYYRPDRLRVVIVGGTDEAAIRGVFAAWDPPDGSAPPLSGRSVSPEPAPQLMAPWVGLAYDGRGIRLPALAIAVRLIGDALPAASLREAASELWLHDDGSAVVLIGSGAPDQGGRSASAGAVATALTAALEAAAGRVGPAAVGGARRRIRRDVISASRTPQGLAEVIGDFADRTGDPGAAGRFLAELDDVGADEIAAALRTLAGRQPVTVELAP